MKYRIVKLPWQFPWPAAMTAGMLSGCGKKTETNEKGEEVVELVWYQVGDAQKDAPDVIEKVNEYTEEKIGVKIKVNNVAWGDYNQKMQVSSTQVMTGICALPVPGQMTICRTPRRAPFWNWMTF